MTTISQEFERAAHDMMAMPSMRDNIEIAVAGGALAALLGYLKTRDRQTATRYAMWGAGIGVGGQYLIFHMLKPAMKQFGRSAQAAAALVGHHRGPVVGAPFGHHMPMHGGMGGMGGMGMGYHHHMQQQQMPCPPGMMYSPQMQQCIPTGMGH
jgi:hypothetical protein